MGDCKSEARILQSHTQGTHLMVKSTSRIWEFWATGVCFNVLGYSSHREGVAMDMYACNSYQQLV